MHFFSPRTLHSKKKIFTWKNVSLKKNFFFFNNDDDDKQHHHCPCWVVVVRTFFVHTCFFNGRGKWTLEKVRCAGEGNKIGHLLEMTFSCCAGEKNLEKKNAWRWQQKKIFFFQKKKQALFSWIMTSSCLMYYCRCIHFPPFFKKNKKIRLTTKSILYTSDKPKKLI